MNIADEARTTLEAVQQLIGVSWSRMVALIGPVTGAVWWWALVATSEKGPDDRPLTVAKNLLDWLSVSASWPDRAASWLAAHADSCSGPYSCQVQRSDASPLAATVRPAR